MEDSGNLSDLDLEVPPKMSFEEAKAQIFKDPKQLRHKNELLKAMYYYCKDQKKNSRVITLFFWPIIASLIQDQDKKYSSQHQLTHLHFHKTQNTNVIVLIFNCFQGGSGSSNSNKVALFGLKILNSLIQEEGINEEIIAASQSVIQLNKQLSASIQGGNGGAGSGNGGSTGNNIGVLRLQGGGIVTEGIQANSSNYKNNLENGRNSLVQINGNGEVNYQESIIEIIKEAKIATQEEIEADRKYYIERMKEILKHSQNPIRILKEKILNTDSTLIMNEATKALRNFSKTTGGIDALMQDGTLLKLVRNKFLESDPLSQQHILEIISSACKFQPYRKELAQHEDFIDIIMSQVISISTSVTYMTLKIFRQLAKDEQNLEHLQGDKLRLSHKLIYAFKWLDSKNNMNDEVAFLQGDQNAISGRGSAGESMQRGSGAQQNNLMLIQDSTQPNELDMIYREISKTFQYILKYYDIHQKLLNNAQAKQQNQSESTVFTEADIIEIIISLGKATTDPKTTLNAATSLAHITEILHCNEAVATQEAIEFMMDMLKDTKNIKHHRQGCRYFANLSFYSNHRNSLVQNKITAYLLGAIESDGLLDEDTIKHSAIALANLSSHKDFMAQTQKAGKGDIAQVSKVERGKIKPLIHLLDSAKETKLNLIQSACITLCNMASKPSLHQHFVQEPEISTIKNCLQNPIDKEHGNELTRFMIKLVCNLTKNPEIVPQLAKKGFLEVLFDLLNHEKEKDIFGNVVTAIAYMSVLKECQDKIVKNKIMPRMLEPITIVHEVDQKLVIIALTSLLFNGYELQREFIKYKGLDTLTFFMNQKEKIFQQLSSKCFSLLSENVENLEDILEQDCLSTVIVSCLKTKDIDLETLKEVTKIFINLILWRKLKKDQIETTCYLCDIGFMIRDLDINILAIFCLNSLSENEYSHQYIIKSCIDEGANAEDLTQQSSIFSRINFLLDLYEQHQKAEDRSQSETMKYELLVQLITSFYLNLSRNDDNLEFLLNLKLFKKLNGLMMIQLQNQKVKASDNTALCYTNTVFGKLLKTVQSRKQCIEEDGHKLFINILKNKQNEYLFLETLDSIKLFLTKREYLSKFQQIPSAMELSDTSAELNVSYLQVLAILSFEKENHKPLKEINFVEKVHRKKLFDQIFTSFHHMNQENKNKLALTQSKKNMGSKEQQNNQLEEEKVLQNVGLGGKKKTKAKIDKEKDLELTLAVSILLANLSSDDEFIRNMLAVQKWKKKDTRDGTSGENQNMSQMNQMLSSSYHQHSQVHSQLSDQTLSVHKEDLKQEDEYSDHATQNNNRFNPRAPLSNQLAIIGHSQSKPRLLLDEGATTGNVLDSSRYSENENNNLNLRQGEIQQILEEYYDDIKLEQFEEVRRIKDMLDLLSHENQFVTEQIAILLANISNSPYFKQIFISPQAKRAMEKILKLDKKHKPTQVTLLAVLIGVLNLSSLRDLEKGQENQKFFGSLEDIIKNDQLPYVTKSIALLAISNIYSLSKQIQISHETRDFAFHVLSNWKQIAEEHHLSPSGAGISNAIQDKQSSLTQSNQVHFQNQQMSPNTAMLNQQSSLVMSTAYNSNNQNEIMTNINLFSAGAGHLVVHHSTQQASLGVQSYNQHLEIVKNLIYSSLILFYNMILKKPSKEIIKKLIVLINDNIIGFEDSQIVNIVLELITLFTKEKEIALLVFKNSSLIDYTFDKLKSSHKETLKLSALALSRLAARLDEYNSEFFISGLKKFKDFETVVENVNKISNSDQIDQIMKYFLNFLENITSFKKSRDELNCSKLYDSTIILYTEKISLENKISLINIIFNLNFNLTEPRVLSKEFLKLLYKTYKDESLKEDQKTLRKIIVLIVSASALEDNHKNLIKSGFYTQFKKNINELYEKLIEANEEVELFGLVNIALNKKYMHLIYQDLKKIYKIALKNQKIDFKTKVDLFSECSKFLAKISQSSPEKGNTGTNEKDISEMIDHCLKALLFCLIQLIQMLDESQYPMFKYFLNAILESTKNLKNHLIILIKIDHLQKFLSDVLEKDFEFNMKDFDDQVLNFSLRIIVCEIFFNLKFERNFFKRENITEQIRLLVNFAQKVITMNIDKKMVVVSNTLRLLSQMIASIHAQPLAHEKIQKTNAIEFVKEAMTLSKDLQPAINIDALFCLTNMMNVKELALDQSILCQETVSNALIIYFAYSHQVELDECIITFLYSISKLSQYQVFLKDKSKVLFHLMDKHLDVNKGEGYKESCRKKIFSTVHNMTENEEVCRQLNVAKFIALTNKMLLQTQQNMYSADHIHELALKSLINMCRNSNEGLEEANLKELFSGISRLYSKFKILAKQYSLRLITILTKQWNAQKIEEYLVEIVDIISQFIERCDTLIEIKLALLNIERISFFKKLMIKLSEINCEQLIKNIAHFIQKSMQKDEYQASLEQLIKFCKKFSKQSDSHHQLIQYKIHELSLEYISKFQSINLNEMNDKQLRQVLTAIQNVMKLVKNLYESGGNSGNQSGGITETQRQEIVEKVSAREGFIAMADSLLQNQQVSSNDELAIMIVNIIICFNSIQNKLDQDRVKGWISNFSARLVESSKPEFQKSRQWYLEKYVFIIELLVIKNIDKIDKEITEEILKIIEIDTSAFTKTIWFKIIKILGHLQYLQELTSQQTLESIFKFIIQAYEKANEHLCFYYFVRVIIIIIKKVDNNALFRASKFYQIIFGSCVQFLKCFYKQKNDPLILEILLYLVDFFKFLMNFSLLYPSLNNNEIINCFVEMIGIHDNPSLLKGITSSLVEASKITVFFPDILNDQSLATILNKIINGTNMDSKSLDNLSDCFKNILIQTKIPIKYLLASTILKMTEPKANWKEKEEGNIITIMKILQQIIKSLEESKDAVAQTSHHQMDEENMETFSELLKKSTKYSLVAITNILIKTHPENVFNRRLNLTQILIDYSSFDIDVQMNLRFLYLLYISTDKNNWKDVQPNQLQALTNFLLLNIQKYSSVLHMKESYHFEIPQYKNTANTTIQAVNASATHNPPLNIVHSNSTGLVYQSNQNMRELSGQITVGILDNQAINQMQQPSLSLGIASIQGSNADNHKFVKAQSSNTQMIQQDLLSVQGLGGNGSSSPSSSQASSSVNGGQYYDYFFFENDDQPLRKIDAIRLSLCMTVKILYKSASIKKKQNCQLILENEMSSELFKYLTQFLENGDTSCLKQIYKVIKIFQASAEFIQLHQTILSKDTIMYLIKIAEKIVQEDSSEGSPDQANKASTFTQVMAQQQANTNGTTAPLKTQDEENTGTNMQDFFQSRKKAILTSILKTLMSLCTTSEFHWHLTKYNIMDLLTKIKEKEDSQINELVKEFWEKVVYHSNESTFLINEQDFHNELINIIHEPESRQVKVLQNMESIVIQKKVKLEKLGNQELDVMLQLLKQRLNDHESTFESIHIKKVLLNLINFVYVNKFLKDTTLQPSILFQNQENIVSTGQQQYQKTNQSDSNSQSQQQFFNNNQMENIGSLTFVACVVEKQETLETLMSISQNPILYGDLFEKTLELLSSYSQSTHLRDECLLNYVLPTFQNILNHRDHVTVAAVNIILNTLIKLLKVEDTSHILLTQYDLPLLLTQIISNQIAFHNDMFNTNLEIIIKLMYYSPEKVSESSEQFLISLINNQHSTELNRLGLFSLYCISLAIQEQNQVQNIFIFEKDNILRGVFSFLNSVRIKKQGVDNTRNSMMQAIQKSDQMSSFNSSNNKQHNTQQFSNIGQASPSNVHQSNQNSAQNINSKLKQVALQIIINVLELVTSDICISNMQLADDCAIIAQKIVMDFNLLTILSIICFNNEFTAEDRKLAARGFASIPFNLLFKINPLIFQKQSSQLQSDTFTIQTFFQALVVILRLNDQESSYFALYTLFSFLHSLNFVQDLQQEQQQQKQLKGQDQQQVANTQHLGISNVDQAVKSKLSQMDYPIMCSCLIKSELMHQVFLVPLNSDDEDVIRVSMKLLILILFKGQYSKILSFQEQQISSARNVNNHPPNSTKSKVDYNSFLSQLVDKLEIDIDPELHKCRDQLKQLFTKFQHFEVTQINQAGYVQFLHLLSQIVSTSVVTSNNAFIKNEERLKIMPPPNVLAEIIIKSAIHFQSEKDPFKILSQGDDPTRKMMIYRYFYFNYLLSVTIPHLISHLHLSMFHNTSDETMKDIPDRIFKTLLQVLELFKDRNLNAQIDQLMVYNANLEIRHQRRAIQYGDEEEKQGLKNNYYQGAEDGDRIDEDDDEEEDIDDENSTTFSLIKMMLFNLNKLLKSSLVFYNDYHNQDAKKFKQGKLFLPEFYTLQEQAFELIVSLLLDNEEDENIVESVYSILDFFISIARSDPTHENVKVMEGSKMLMSLAVKHTAIYECESSYQFLIKLTTISEKYKGKPEVEKALLQIIPHQLRQQSHNTHSHQHHPQHHNNHSQNNPNPSHQHNQHPQSPHPVQNQDQ